jgi:hypothetical protein
MSTSIAKLFPELIASARERIHAPSLREENLVWYELVRIPNWK